MSWSQVKHLEIPFFTPLSNSNRTHKLCQLPNGLLVLLISEPTENASACALTVAAGSHNDPDGIPGIAHLCEHMLLAGGSKKYPSPNFYHDLITANNGSHNAFTSGEQTTFCFELPDFHQAPEASFEKAIEVFASFFLEPLFEHSLLNKEIHAIQNEHDCNVSNSSKMLYHATRLLCDHNHPFSRFSTGNIMTLKHGTHSKGQNLRNLLLGHFRENYEPSKMTLCLRGPQSVNNLAKLAISCFGEIPAHKRRGKRSEMIMQRSPDQLSKGTRSIDVNILHDTWWRTTAAGDCFPQNSKWNTICINSIKNPIIRLLFPVWQKNTSFTVKEFWIFGRSWFELFGDESPGSFSHFLAEKGWATYCFAFTSKFCTSNMGLVLELSLTASGWQNVEKIVQTLMNHLVPKFSRGSTHQLARFLSEQFSIDLIRFLYSTTESSPMSECSDLSELLQEDLDALDVACLFMGSPMVLREEINRNLFGEDEDSRKWWIEQALKFQSFLKTFMNCANMRLIMLGNVAEASFPRPYEQHNLAASDQFYEFSYTAYNLDLTRPEPSSPDYKFHIPPQNEFKPAWGETFSSLTRKLNYSLSRSQQASLGFSTKNEDSIEVPQLVSQNEKYEMWVLSDGPNSPYRSKSIVSFELSCCEMHPSPLNTMNLEILAQILNIVLVSHLYPSLKLGFSYEIYPSSRGDVRLGFTISGFSRRLSKVIKSLVDLIRRLGTEDTFPSKELFRRARILVRRNYEKAEDNNSVNLASVGLLILMEKFMWGLDDRLDAIENIDLRTFKSFTTSFAKNCNYLMLFIQGDLSHADEINSCIDRNLTRHLRGSRAGSQAKPEFVSTKMLEPATNLYFEHAGRQDDPTNSIVYYLQTGARGDSKAYTLTALSDYLMSFTLTPELRNRWQIGYVVMGGLRLLQDAVGLHISIMSGLEPMVLEEKINEYLVFFEKEVLTPMSEATFREKYVDNFLRLQAKGLVDKSRTADLMDTLAANVQCGDSDILNSSTMKDHRKFRNSIANGRFTSGDSGETIDARYLKELTLAQYWNFFRERIAVHSKEKRKLSIMVKSPMTDDEIVNRQIFLQIEALLKLYGLTIETTELRGLVQRSGGKPTLLIKELYKYFHSRRETWRLCSIALRELLKMLSVNLNFRQQRRAKKSASQWDSTPEITLTLIEDINAYRKDII